MTAFALRLIALVSMLMDHIYHAFLPDQLWLHCIGRLAFPIFAFQLATGYCLTHSKRSYALRLALFALLSEVPFDLMAYGTPFYPGHQNVMWTLLLGFLVIHLTEKALQMNSDRTVRIVIIFFVVFLPATAASALCLDYGYLGIVQIFVFYVLRNKSRVLQTFCILLINLLMGGAGIPVAGIQLPIQGLAVLAMIPILLYNGRQGPKGKAWTRFCYIFYPAHLLILALFA